MKQNMSLGMNRATSCHKGVTRYSDKYKDVLERAYKKDQIIKQKPKQLFFYRIRSIGVGAFSFVYLVSQESSGTVFAQKSISKKSIAPQLFTEIKMHLALRHSNIVNLYHIYSQQAYVQLIMDFAGQSLFSLRKNSKLPLIMTQQQTIIILKQLISAVSYLHSRRIVHADIKLQNILYLQGVIKLCDFGFAHIAKTEQFQSIKPKQNEAHKQNRHKQYQFQHYEQGKDYQNKAYTDSYDYYEREKQNQPLSTQSKQVVGTLEYLDPEYVQGSFSQYSRDIWAIGIVAYELLVGRNPFQSMAQNQKWSHILKIKQINLDNLLVSKKMRRLLQITLCPISKRANITALQNLQMFQHQQYGKIILQPQEVKFFQ